MPELIVQYPDRAPDTFPLGRLRITIGRSARNDVCIPDPFASRVHAEVRREGDVYVMQDLGSANGTLFNGARAEAPMPLAPPRVHQKVPRPPPRPRHTRRDADAGRRARLRGGAGRALSDHAARRE